MKGIKRFSVLSLALVMGLGLGLTSTHDVQAKVQPTGEVSAIATAPKLAANAVTSIADLKDTTKTNEGTTYTVHGIITAYQSRDVYLCDKDTGSGIMLYNPGDLKNKTAIGDEVEFSAKLGAFSGARQLSSPFTWDNKIISKNNVVKAKTLTALSDINAQTAGDLFTVSGLTVKSIDNKFAENKSNAKDNKDSSMTFNFGSETLTLFAKKYNKGDAKKLYDEILKDDAKGITSYSMTSNAMIHDTAKQFVVTNVTEIKVENYASFMNALVMDKNVDNQCVANFPIAKKYFLAMTTEEQETFKTSTDTDVVKARARYLDWAANRHQKPYEAGATSNLSFASKDNMVLIVSVTSVAILAISLIAVFTISKKRKANR